MASVALLGDVLWVISAVLYVRHWHTRLIKASSRQLCVIMLFGIFVAYNAMFAFIGMPRNEVRQFMIFNTIIAYKIMTGGLEVSVVSF